MKISEEELEKRIKVFAEAFHREFRRQALMQATLWFKKCVKPKRKIRRRK